ncbi:nuclear pore complex Nup98-Nup96-like [Paramuricea clavata]|uniref:Nuclear pore complex Nup98-Nup96-like n=1 Tax=Paramuricea clavata TaxID=317549 RepID=A0A6S7G6K8_PARCT|nr:nuclear pore complex Nup98-Nup96-like [Paramuricea clavata]
MVLAEQVNGYKMMISDLNTKIKDLDNEKNSLVSAIKILQEGQKCEETGPLNAVKRQIANSPATKKQFKQSGMHYRYIQTQNRYSILSETDNDGEDTLTSQKRSESGITPVAKDTVIVTQNSGTENSKDTDYRSSEIVLIGDSIIKILTQKSLQRGKFKNWRIGNHDETRYRSGAKYQTSQQKLEDLSKNHNVSFIDNSGINNTCLNGGKLHLNPKGSAFLATNFIRFLKGEQHVSPRRPRRSSTEDFHAIANQLLMTLLAGTSRSNTTLTRCDPDPGICDNLLRDITKSKEEYESIKELLVEIAPRENSSQVNHWNTGGQIYLDYIKLWEKFNDIKNGLLVPNVYQLEKMQTKVSSLCYRISQLPSKTATDRLCQSDMGTMCANFLKIIAKELAVQSDESETSYHTHSSVLAPHIEKLPLPEDCCLTELRELASSYIDELAQL